MVDSRTAPQHEARVIPPDHYRNLKELEAGYWWFVGRVEWAMHLVDIARSAQHLGPIESYADIGCGTGGFGAALTRALRPSHVVLVDSSPEALAAARESGLPVLEADATQALELPFQPQLITLMDVIEHADDDEAVLTRIASVMPSGSILVLSVPAHAFLFSTWDSALGHRRRYSSTALRRKLERAGFRVTLMRHMWSFLFPLAPFRKYFSSGNDVPEFPRVAPLINRALIHASRWEWRLQRTIPLPFGTSIILSAVKA